MSRRAYHSGEHSKTNRDMAKPQTIGSYSLDTQAAAIAFIQEVLYRRPLLEPIRDADHEFLLELLKKHPRKTEKIGLGVKHFTVEKAQGGTQCF
jgi:hypothetical protein